MRLRIRLPSVTLLKPVEIQVAFPYGLDAAPPPYRVVWALHCAMGGGDFFFERLDAASIVDKAQVAIIAPSMGNGYFVNSSFERQADFLQEMFEALRELFPLSQRREDNMVVGISMGGFGALRWALESDVFANAVSISGVFDCRIPLDARMMKNRAQRALHAAFEGVMRRCLLDDAKKMRPDADIRLLLQKRPYPSFPRVHLYCGEQDYLSLPQTAYAMDVCTQYNCPIELHLSEGDHNKSYWKIAFDDAISKIFR